jgi:hypothetical protein
MRVRPRRFQASVGISPRIVSVLSRADAAATHSVLGGSNKRTCSSSPAPGCIAFGRLRYNLDRPHSALSSCALCGSKRHRFKSNGEFVGVERIDSHALLHESVFLYQGSINRCLKKNLKSDPTLTHHSSINLKLSFSFASLTTPCAPLQD